MFGLVTTRGEQVALLALIDAGAPGRQPSSEVAASAIGLRTFALDLGLPPDHPELSADRLLQLPADDALAWILEQARQAGLLDVEADLDRIRHLHRLYKANVRALGRYVPRPYEGKIVLLVPENRLGDGDPTLGWGRPAQADPSQRASRVRKPSIVKGLVR